MAYATGVANRPSCRMIGSDVPRSREVHDDRRRDQREPDGEHDLAPRRSNGTHTVVAFGAEARRWRTGRASTLTRDDRVDRRDDRCCAAGTPRAGSTPC